MASKLPGDLKKLAVQKFANMPNAEILDPGSVYTSEDGKKKWVAALSKASGEPFWVLVWEFGKKPLNSYGRC